jgi:hypothetical protein
MTDVLSIERIGIHNKHRGGIEMILHLRLLFGSNSGSWSIVRDFRVSCRCIVQSVRRRPSKRKVLPVRVEAQIDRISVESVRIEDSQRVHNVDYYSSVCTRLGIRIRVDRMNL